MRRNMAVRTSVIKKKNLAEIYVNKLAAVLIVLSFLVITVCVLSTEAAMEYQILYITFDSLIVYVVVRIFQWIATKVLTVYEEMESGQN